MSDHKKPLTALEESGLIAHRLPIGKPSQLADAFRHGIAWAERARLSEPEWIPVGERLPVVPEGLMRIRVWCFNNQTGAVWKTAFHIPEKKMHTQATHWRYAESIPKPPKDNP